MLNFNDLPELKPVNLIPSGTYHATVVKAEMRKPKNDPSKPYYLNLELRLKDKDGKDVGTVFDVISESDKELALYKLRRFIRATGLEEGIKAVGTFKLIDLQKAVGKTVIVDVTQQEAQNGYAAKNQVDTLSRDAYYLSTETEAFARC